jgi:hypothetical protein
MRMTGIEQIASVTATSALRSKDGASAPSVGSNVGNSNVANGMGELPSLGVPDADVAKSVGNDFTKVLETYRVKSERVDAAVNSARSGESSGPPHQREMIKQLADLYTYAVDTQLLVRTSGQLTTGVRQLVTGQ